MSEQEKVGASKAINKFVARLWKEFNLDSRFDRRGGYPTEKREEAINRLRDLMEEAADFYFKRGAIVGIRELSRLRRKAHKKRPTAGILRHVWLARVEKSLPDAEVDFDALEDPW